MSTGLHQSSSGHDIGNAGVIDPSCQIMEPGAVSTQEEPSPHALLQTLHHLTNA
jgi:hypothetical protein